MLVLELKKKLEDLKKKVEEAEEVRNIRRGPNSWENLRTLKKLKLQIIAFQIFFKVIFFFINAIKTIFIFIKK